MEIPPITLTTSSTRKLKKPGRPKSVSWKDDFYDEFFRRLSLCQGEDTLEEETEYLARWFNEKKIRPPGEKAPISASRLRELYRERDGNAEIYKKLRRAYIDFYVDVALTFLAKFPEGKPPKTIGK